MKGFQAQELIRKYREGTLTEQERAILESWYLNLGKSQQGSMQAEELEKNLDGVWKSLPVNRQPLQQTPVTKNTFPLLRSFAVAASVLLFCVLGAYFFYKNDNKPKVEQIALQNDVKPGDNRAMLTLADGKKIMLDNIKTGELAHEGSTAIIKTKEGEVIYQHLSDDSKITQQKSVTYNTIATPNAGQYQIKLPDGTRVWLNAASSIRFPTAFSLDERVVEIVGEVYFEVAKVSNQVERIPFKVFAGGQMIEVLGTRFNVNSYADEGNIKTTLLEGSIKLNVAGNKGKEILLKPGQQARFIPDGHKQSSASHPFNVQEVDTKSVVAWKDGYFRIDNIGLPELMRQLSRWYDMEVVYEGPVKEYEFVGQIERNTNLSAVLKILELSDVHFKIEGKKIIVTQ